MKKFVSFVTAVAMAAGIFVSGGSVFGGLSAAAEEATTSATTPDLEKTADKVYIGEKTDNGISAETFDNYTDSGKNWSVSYNDATPTPFPYSKDSNNFFNVTSITYVEAPEVGCTAKPIESATPHPTTSVTPRYIPTYVNGNSLTMQKRGESTATMSYKMDEKVSSGIVCFDTDYYLYSSYVILDKSISITDGENDVLKIVMPNSSSNRQQMTVTGATSAKSEGYPDARYTFTKEYGMHIYVKLDLDNAAATVSIDYINAGDYLRKQESINVSLKSGASVSQISFSETTGKTNNYGIAIDNTKLYHAQGAICSEPPHNAANGNERTMEKLGRGTTAIYTGSGVYLSWRLLGTESLSNQAFDIYRDGVKIATTSAHSATNYTDSSGTASNKYIVVPSGDSISGETAVVPWTNYQAYDVNAEGYTEISLNVPTWIAPYSDAETTDNTYTANDTSVGDLDGDGEYEFVVKWYPSNAKDSASDGYTSPTIIDAYDTDGTFMWRINLGYNIRSGAHYTQFMVYDLDGDGYAEVVMKTAPGTKDGQDNYVSEVGNTETIRKTDNTKIYLTTSGRIQSGSEYLTVFNGETGAAMQTIDYYPSYSGFTTDQWGDNYGNRADRYLACVAYLNGTTPSVVFTRGYYAACAAAAYDWDGKNLTTRWINTSGTKDSYTVTDSSNNKTTYNASSLYGQGNHSLSVCDADGDGKDEIVFGSAVIDDNGTVLNSTGRGHGDAIHVSDFDNDGDQEIFQVHEAAPYGFDYRNAKTAEDELPRVTASGDTGRGAMAHMDDNYEPDKAISFGYSSAATNFAYTTDGNTLSYDIGVSSSNKYANSLIYWDGLLDRELLDGICIDKFSPSSGGSYRFYYDRKTSYTFSGSSSNNNTKDNACLTADLFGDWREEAVFRVGSGSDQKLRIYMSALPTDYRLYTLMHDSQYRCAVAWQNVGYNQPPHTSYYIGSAALAKDSWGNKVNYLDPKASYTNVKCIEPENKPTLYTPTGDGSTGTYKTSDQEDGTYNAYATTDIVLNNSSVTDAKVYFRLADTDPWTEAENYSDFLNTITGGSDAAVALRVGVTDVPENTEYTKVYGKIVVYYGTNGKSETNTFEVPLENSTSTETTESVEADAVLSSIQSDGE